MLKKNQFVKILFVSLLSLSNSNLFCSSTLDLMNWSDPTYHALVQKIIYTNLNLYKKLSATEREANSSIIIKGQEGSGIKIITEGDNVFISLDSKSIAQMLSNPENAPPANIQTEINKQYDKNIKEKILPANRQKILSIIKNLAPELHKKITEFDQDGSKHIIGGVDLAAVEAVTMDGLPIIHLNNEFFNGSPKVQRAMIAHELGHYALEHRVIRGVTYDEESGKIFNNKTVTTKDDSIKTKSSKGLDSIKAMTAAYVRTYEYEADRFAMINMGVDYQDVEAMITEMNDSTKGRTTFTIDHPLDENRLKQFKAIKTEMELLKKSSVKPAPIDWDQIQYDTLKHRYYSFADKIYKDSPISSRDNHRINFEAAVKRYLPHMLSKAQAEMNEIALAHSYQKKESLSMKEFVSINKFLSQIDSPLIEKIQKCGPACIKKGTEAGIEIEGNELVITFVDENINTINSGSPKAKERLMTKINLSMPRKGLVIEKEKQEAAKIENPQTVPPSKTVTIKSEKDLTSSDQQTENTSSIAKDIIKDTNQPIKTNSNSAINRNKALDLNDGIDFSNQSLNIQQGTEAQDVNDVKHVFSNNLKVNLQTPNNSMNFSDRFKQAFQKAAESTANVFKYSKGLAAQAVANIKSLASQVYRLTPSDIAQAIKSSPSNLLNAVQSIISRKTNNTNSNNPGKTFRPQQQFIIDKSSQEESVTETKEGNLENNTENSEDFTIRGSSKNPNNFSNTSFNFNPTVRAQQAKRNINLNMDKVSTSQQKSRTARF